MNDAQGNWMPHTDEDGVETALQIFNRQLAQRFAELCARIQDRRHPIGETPLVEARKRLMEAR